ncbi:unnamed protein product [Rhizophagus irregularis]|nr:unnamed protein product [Rhizophagus irregularis]
MKPTQGTLYINDLDLEFSRVPDIHGLDTHGNKINVRSYSVEKCEITLTTILTKEEVQYNISASLSKPTAITVCPIGLSH